MKWFDSDYDHIDELLHNGMKDIERQKEWV